GPAIDGERLLCSQRDSARQEPDHAFEQAAERRANGVGEIESCLLEYALCMAQGLETFVAVVGAHAARSDAAKWNVLLGIMQIGFVDGDATGCRPLEDQPPSGTVGAEKVKGQWTRP